MFQSLSKPKEPPLKPPPPPEPLQASIDTKPLTSARTVSTNLAADRIEPLKMSQTPSNLNNSAKNSTIESLLMDLEKIDRESELMLNTDSKSDKTSMI